MANHFVDTLRGRLPVDPAAAAFLETADGTRWSYADLLARSSRYASALRALGLQPGDRLAVQVEKSPAVVALYLGCLRAGGVFLPMNTAYTAQEVAYLLGDARPRVFVCDPAHASASAHVAREAGVLEVATLGSDGGGGLADLADAQMSEVADVPRGPDDIAAILYTSGTTGRPKGAMLSHANLASNAATLVEAWRVAPGDVLIHALPLFHTHGLFVATNVTLMAGASLILLPKLDAPLILSLMARATMLMGVPTFYTRLLKEAGLSRESTAGMRLFISGSAPLLAETHRDWFDRTGHRILERYGMTETNMNTSNPYDGERLAGSVGLPLPGVEVRVVDPEAGSPLGAGEIGMIEVRGPNVFRGYWNLPEKTAAEFREDGFFVTGDLGRIDPAGYVHIVGRGKDLIITGGYNVYPKEVETEIDALAGVGESAVIGVPHADFGEGVTAIVVPNGAATGERQVIAALEERLAKYKIPKRVIFVEALPRNAMGKVQKNLLRDEYAGLFSRRADAAAG